MVWTEESNVTCQRRTEELFAMLKVLVVNFKGLVTAFNTLKQTIYTFSRSSLRGKGNGLIFREHSLGSCKLWSTYFSLFSPPPSPGGGDGAGEWSRCAYCYLWAHTEVERARTNNNHTHQFISSYLVCLSVTIRRRIRKRRSNRLWSSDLGSLASRELAETWPH